MRYVATIVIVWLGAGLSSGSLAVPAGNSQEALRYLNTLREQTGLAPLRVNDALEQAAEDHARYLARHKQGNPHRQQPGRSGFTGRTADDRAVVAGYPTRQAVSENISRGQRTPKRSIDALMSAIYHRLGFLDSEMTEIGVGEGLGQSRLYRTFVYLMGNHYLAALCAGKAPTNAYPKGTYTYDQVCEDGRRVSVAQWQAATVRPKRDGPAIVLWPPPDSDHILPAFYDEIPDPLPRHKVSGAVISVQFNPVNYPLAIDVKRFDLWDQATGRKLPPILLMQQNNDPNKKFTAHQFALFPYDRLRWGQRYRAEFEYEYAGRMHIERWSFRTRALPYPIIPVAARGGRYALASGQTTALVIAPSLGRELYRNVRWSTPKGMNVNIDWEDNNTLLVKLQGKTCAEVELRFAHGFRLTLVEEAKGGCAAAGLSAEPSLEQPAAGVPPKSLRASVAADTPENTVAGKGELMAVRSGERYIFSVKPTMVYPQLGTIRYRSKGDVKVDIEPLSEHRLALRAVGKAGASVTLDLGDGRYFKVVLQ